MRGRLWRATNPHLTRTERTDAVGALMTARSAVRAALRTENADALRSARAGVDSAKHRLGERGPAWWTDGAPDLNRRMARNTIYADWFAEQEANIGVDAAKEQTS